MVTAAAACSNALTDVCRTVLVRPRSRPAAAGRGTGQAQRCGLLAASARLSAPCLALSPRAGLRKRHRRLRRNAGGRQGGWAGCARDTHTPCRLPWQGCCQAAALARAHHARLPACQHYVQTTEAVPSNTFWAPTTYVLERVNDVPVSCAGIARCRGRRSAPACVLAGRGPLSLRLCLELPHAFLLQTAFFIDEGDASITPPDDVAELEAAAAAQANGSAAGAPEAGSGAAGSLAAALAGTRYLGCVIVNIPAVMGEHAGGSAAAGNGRAVRAVRLPAFLHITRARHSTLSTRCPSAPSATADGVVNQTRNNVPTAEQCCRECRKLGPKHWCAAGGWAGSAVMPGRQGVLEGGARCGACLDGSPSTCCRPDYSAWHHGASLPPRSNVYNWCPQDANATCTFEDRAVRLSLQPGQCEWSRLCVGGRASIGRGSGCWHAGRAAARLLVPRHLACLALRRRRAALPGAGGLLGWRPALPAGQRPGRWRLPRRCPAFGLGPRAGRVLATHRLGPVRAAREPLPRLCSVSARQSG